MLKPVALVLSLVLLSACASTNTAEKPVQQTANQTAFEVTDGKMHFLDQKDGSKFQPRTGLHCPAIAMNGTLDKTHVYNEKSTDVSCRYNSDENMTTIYLTQSFETLDQNFGSSFAAVEQGTFKDKIEYREELTENCMVENQLISGVMGMLLGETKKDNTVTIDMSGNSGDMPYKMAIFGSDELSSYLAVSPIDGKFMKIRYTAFNGLSKEQAMNDCRDIYTLMKNQIASVGKPGGAEPQGSILDLLADN